MLLSQSLQQLKVADFGLCTYFEKNASLTANRGHEKYMAPEVRTSADQTQLRYSFACDVYSWALCCYYALTGSEREKPQASELPTIIQRRLITDTNCTLAAFLNAAISDDARKRPTSAECEAILKTYEKNCKGQLFSILAKRAIVSDSPPQIFHRQPQPRQTREHLLHSTVQQLASIESAQMY